MTTEQTKKLSFNKWLTTEGHTNSDMIALAAVWGAPRGRPTANFVKRRAASLGFTEVLGEAAYNTHQRYLGV